MTQSPCLPESDWHPKSFERAFSCEHMEKFWQEGYEAGSAAAAQAVPENITGNPVACMIRHRTCTPARTSFDGMVHWHEWSSWEPATLEHGRAVTDPRRNHGEWEMQPTYFGTAAPTQGAEGAAPQAVTPDRDFTFLRFPELYPPQGVVGEASEDSRAWVYRLNLLESCANWLESRSRCTTLNIKADPVEGGGYESLMRQYAQDLRVIRSVLALTPSPTSTAPQEADAPREALHKLAADALADHLAAGQNPTLENEQKAVESEGRLFNAIEAATEARVHATFDEWWYGHDGVRQRQVAYLGWPCTKEIAESIWNAARVAPAQYQPQQGEQHE